MDHDRKPGKVFEATPYDTLGQFSFAPATQTTIVTTTTTTTTTFPPFAINAPKHLQERDPEQYPLAWKPTPQSIKKLEFEVNGSSAYFEEAENPELRVRELKKQYASLAAQKGTLRSITNIRNNPNTRKQVPRPVRSTFLGTENRTSASITPRSTQSTSAPNRLLRNEYHASTLDQSRSRPHPLQQSQESASGSETCEESEQDLDDDLESVVAKPRRKTPHTLRRESAHFRSDFRPEGIDALGVNAGNVMAFGGSVTPPEGNFEPIQIGRIRRETRRRSAAPGMLNTSPVLDASLPSPILSPVTAAANLARSGVSPPVEETEDESQTDSQESAPSFRPIRVLSPPGQISLARLGEAEFQNSQLPTPAPTDIPSMLDSFDAMPEEMKTYLMYQFLRRCTKSTLHFVADVVNPAMKCDFLARLPLELSLNIVRCLNVQSMCRAAQVSRKWRRIVDSDEKAWKDLLDADGFKLPEGEIQQAVMEGWGWQFPTGEGEWERNINLEPLHKPTQNVFLNEAYVPYRSGVDDSVELTPSRLRKRKPKLSSESRTRSQKKQKRKASAAEDRRKSLWMISLDDAHGPNAYANAAAVCVPNPDIGLSSLRNLHLFKSLYTRHHLIRRSWMNPETKPLHLAFRAHRGHVVTCLQFDGEKIITGSDDANIDIYSTESGASIKRLGGHEGGVWALECEGNILVSGSTDRTVRVWNIKEGKCLQTWQGHTSTVRCLQIIHPVPVGQNPDGTSIMMPKQSLIITGSRDSSCRVWKLPSLDDTSLFQAVANDEQNPYFVRALTGHHHSVRAIAAHGDTLVSGSYDATVRVWKISTGETVHRLQGHTSKVYSVVLDHERNRCISGSMDSFVKVWSLETGSCLLHLEGHTSLVGLLDLVDNYLVSAAADATLRVWDPETGRCKQILYGHTGAITCFSHDGEKVISGSDQTLKMWDAKRGKFVRDLLVGLNGVWQVKFDERRCIAAVHRNSWTYIEVIDFGAARDGVDESQLGRRIVVDSRGREVIEDVSPATVPTNA